MSFQLSPRATKHTSKINNHLGNVALPDQILLFYISHVTAGDGQLGYNVRRWHVGVYEGEI